MLLRFKNHSRERIGNGFISLLFMLIFLVSASYPRMTLICTIRANYVCYMLTEAYNFLTKKILVNV